MKIHIAREAGFCFGVKRALKIVDQLYKNEQDIQTYGPLIHNRTVLEELNARGIAYTKTLRDIDPGKKLVIRTHGIPLGDEQYLNSKQQMMVDATCPLVKKIHRIIQKLDGKENLIVIVGDIHHPEVIAAKSYSENSLVINSIPEAEDLTFQKHIVLVAQTTLSEVFFNEIIAKLLKKTDHLEVFNTICTATRVRQMATKELAEMVDFMVVIGGKNSSNTKKLAQIAREKNNHTYHFETYDDLVRGLPLTQIKNFSSVGISAGASTPPSEIQKVRDFFEKLEFAKEINNGK